MIYIYVTIFPLVLLIVVMKEIRSLLIQPLLLVHTKAPPAGAAAPTHALTSPLSLNTYVPSSLHSSLYPEEDGEEQASVHSMIPRFDPFKRARIGRGLGDKGGGGSAATASIAAAVAAQQQQLQQRKDPPSASVGPRLGR